MIAWKRRGTRSFKAFKTGEKFKNSNFGLGYLQLQTAADKRRGLGVLFFCSKMYLPLKIPLQGNWLHWPSVFSQFFSHFFTFLQKRNGSFNNKSRNAPLKLENSCRMVIQTQHHPDKSPRWKQNFFLPFSHDDCFHFHLEKLLFSFFLMCFSLLPFW